MAMAEGAVGTASTALAFAVPVNVSNNVEPTLPTISTFAVRRDGEGKSAEIASTEEGLYVSWISLNSDKAMQGKSLRPQPFRDTVAASASSDGVRLSVEVATPRTLVVLLRKL